MNKQTLYVVGAVKQSNPVSLWGREHDLPLTWADGMIGVLPVFDNIGDANEYAAGKYQILQIEVERLSTQYQRSAQD